MNKSINPSEISENQSNKMVDCGEHNMVQQVSPDPVLLAQLFSVIGIQHTLMEIQRTTVFSQTIAQTEQLVVQCSFGISQSYRVSVGTSLLHSIAPGNT